MEANLSSEGIDTGNSVFYHIELLLLCHGLRRNDLSKAF
jgi:hypothetical protein